ncbi:RsmB/NOP family class I SAM-dependent RNA methyltransferase [Thiorhodococcus minor]|uniref:RsmB/NOP family class I SAM-dependent RNA methyltransferase n=1 Tax=Thiorhodococcus minor TaxID=57489 RepID=A0A6M0JU44_9GAMM|nr:RsmB/NOP family class I SAM-dependent RNA methyltransferase [Thiorhodococcus minor]NEV61080.1 RsmB/NOP family class I SAM-dependent RNA methyltransferase [Thiorhodococcus minor]
MTEHSGRGSAASLNTPADVAASALSRYRDLVDDWDAFAAALCRPLPGSVWANPTRIGVDALAGLLAEQGVEAVPVSGLPGALQVPASFRTGQQWWYCIGLAHAQEVVSQIPATLMDLRPGQRVLDMCAAPGGKTAQIAFALGNRGTLVANDVSFQRIKALQGNLDRLGVVNVTTTCGDAGNWPAAGGQFDRILVDAPCSSEGTVRRNASLLQRMALANSERLGPRQRALLRKAVQRCRPGGRILYSTCTFAPEENELVVADILAELPDALRLVPVSIPGFRTAPGITAWQGRELPADLAHCHRFWPHHNDTGGFFIAVLEKRGDLPSEPEPKPAELSDAEHDDWLTGLDAKYGFPEDYWTHYRVNRQTRRGLHLMAADHVPPAVPKSEGSGLFFHRTNVRPPKPTTAGALLLGRDVSRFRLELTQAQRDAYMRRETFEPTAAQAALDQRGQMMVTYAGHALGVAIFHRSGVIESQFPRRWSGCAAGPQQGQGGAPADAED